MENVVYVIHQCILWGDRYCKCKNTFRTSFSANAGKYECQRDNAFVKAGELDLAKTASNLWWVHLIASSTILLT